MLISKVNKFLTSNVSTLRNTSISRKNPAIFQVFDKPGKLIIMEVKFAEVKKTNFFFLIPSLLLNIDLYVSVEFFQSLLFLRGKHVGFVPKHDSDKFAQ